MADHLPKLISDLQLYWEQMSSSTKDNLTVWNTENDSFVVFDFWRLFLKSSQILVEEAKKLNTALSNHPPLTAKVLQPIFSNFESSVDTFYNMVHSFSISAGYSVSCYVLQLVETISKGITDFIQALSIKEKSGVQTRAQRISFLLSTYHSIEQYIKLDNALAAERFLMERASMLRDVVDDIEEEIEASVLNEDTDVDNSEIWSYHDRLLLTPYLNLFKTARYCVRRVGRCVGSSGKTDTREHIAELDAVRRSAEPLSLVLDSLSTFVFPPMDHKALRRSAVQLVAVVQNMLMLVQQAHFTQQNDRAWQERLLKAVDHKNNRLHPLLVLSGSEESSDEENAQAQDEETTE